MLNLTGRCFIILIFVCLISSATAQVNDQSDHDEGYYINYPELITARFYFSKKSTNFNIGGTDINPDLDYHPNTSLNMGVGATYRSFTLNLAYGFGFLNNNSEKGKTKYLDLQSHLYSRAWAVDLSGQFYKGYYLNNRLTGYSGNSDFYLRPDIGITLLGASVYRIINNDKFSLRAATLQSEWQQKSAGSILIGAEIFYGSVHADSSFVPSLFADRYKQAGINKLRLLKLGPGIGYAYTFVYEKHYYLTWSLSASLNAGPVNEFNAGVKTSKQTLSPNYNYRFAIGYNSDDWACNLMLLGNEINFKGVASPETYNIKTGNFRLNIAKRLVPGPKVKEKIKILDRVLQ